jgi:hypothetical protein
MQWANIKEESTDNINTVRITLILQKQTGSRVEHERDGDVKNARTIKEDFLICELC